jgi:hypothetical protein
MILLPLPQCLLILIILCTAPQGKINTEQTAIPPTQRRCFKELRNYRLHHFSRMMSLVKSGAVPANVLWCQLL